MAIELEKYSELSRDFRANRRSIQQSIRVYTLRTPLIIECITNLRAISSLKLCSTIVYHNSQ